MPEPLYDFDEVVIALTAVTSEEAVKKVLTDHKVPDYDQYLVAATAAELAVGNSKKVLNEFLATLL